MPHKGCYLFDKSTRPDLDDLHENILIAYAISLILLYRYVSYGKKVYVAVIVIGVILDLAGGAYIMTSISFNLAGLGSMITGAILTLLFFSP